MPSLRQALLSVVWVLLALSAVVAVAYERTAIPRDLNALATQQDNVYYWADGTEMARVGPIDRQAMPLDRIPSGVQWAVLAAENANFYNDHGVSPRGIARAVEKMATGGDVQGGSTITQQYVKNVYLNQHQTLSRKFSEIFISIKLDNKVSKQQILDGYLNTSWFGRGAYGVQRAAKAYYGKDVSQLNPSQGAFLATLLKGAGEYDPAISPANHRRAVARWNWVLDRMVTIGQLTAKQRATYTTFPEPIAPPPPVGLSGQSGYLVDTARVYISAHSGISDAQFDLGGYQIYTTFQKPKTTALAAAVTQQLTTLDPATRPADRNVRVGAASVATNGQILALYGGPDYLTQGFNDANISIVPAGTTYTPFVYAAALRDGITRTRDHPPTPITPTTLYNGDDHIPIQTPEGPYWNRDGKVVTTTNTNHQSYGPITLHQAIADNVNGPLMQLGMDTGINQVRQASIDAGLLPDSGFGEQNPDFSLGTATPSPIRMASAYATFADHGTHTAPYSVLHITHNGQPTPLQPPTTTHPFTPTIAHDLTTALHDTLTTTTKTTTTHTNNNTTSQPPPTPTRPTPDLAGTPGTAPDNTSATFTGYNTTMATDITLFRINPKTQQLQPLTGIAGQPPTHTGSTYPTTIWTHYMETLPH